MEKQTKFGNIFWILGETSRFSNRNGAPIKGQQQKRGKAMRYAEVDNGERKG